MGFRVTVSCHVAEPCVGTCSIGTMQCEHPRYSLVWGQCNVRQSSDIQSSVSTAERVQCGYSPV